MLKGHSLSSSLVQTWDDYEKHVHRARKNISTKNIHALRISTQRLEAILTLIQSVKATSHSKNIISLIKKVRRSLGPLRDIHVGEGALKDLKSKEPKNSKSEKFLTFFSRQKSDAKEKARKGLERISLKTEKSHIMKLVKKLLLLERNEGSSKIQKQLDAKVKSSLLKLTRNRRDLKSDRAKEIHQFRILAKKLRYQGECVNSLNGFSNVAIDNLKQAQSVSGKIQNDSVLKKMLIRYLAKKHHRDDSHALLLLKKISAHQDKLIRNDFQNVTVPKWEC